MTSLRTLMAVLALAGALGVAACDQADGPAEQVGQAVDEAAKDTKRAVQDATD